MSPRDTWLYKRRDRGATIEKSAAIERRGLFDASSDQAYRALTEDPRERSEKARITHWGGRSDPRGLVSVSKAAEGEAADTPPASRQLRDPFTTFYVQGLALEPPLPPDRLLNLTEENSLHSACLMAKATDACGRGWEFVPREGKKQDKALAVSEDPEKLRQHMEDITPDLTFTELLYQAAWEMDAIGWGAWESVRTGNNGTPGQHGEIGAIYPLPAHTFRATLDPRKWVQIRAGRVRFFKKFGAECTINNETGELYEWKGKGRALADKLPEEYVASEIILFKTYTPRSLWYGLPRWVSSIATIAELTAIREFNVSWFASGGQVDYHMHFKAGSLEMAKDMKEQVEQQITENAGRGHTKLLTAGDLETEVATNKLGELLREGHFRFRRGDLIKEILIAHNVPPYRIGWAEGAGSLGGNAASEMLGAYRFGAIKPIQQVIEDRLRMTLFDPKIGVKTGAFRFALKELVLEDIKSELLLATSGVMNAFMTPFKAQELLDLDPDKSEPLLKKYYFRGQPLGEKPPQPPGMPGAGGPGGGSTPGAAAPGAGGPKAPGEEKIPTGSPKVTPPTPSAVKEKSIDEDDPMTRAARQIVFEMVSDYEAKLRATLGAVQEPEKKSRVRKP
jgi:hypothetical protein